MSRTAAIFRLEGTLVDASALRAVAHLATNAQGFRERLFRLGHLAAAAPILGVLGQNDRNLATRALYAALRDMSEDRLYVLGEEFADEHLKPKRLDSGMDLLRQARRDGHQIVVVTELVGPVVKPFTDTLRGVDAVLTNTLEVRGGKVTGRLLDPIIGGHETASVIGDYAAEHDIDLSRSVAYTSFAPDQLVLAMVGRPCAVNPDYTLRRAAQGARWPILDYQV